MNASDACRAFFDRLALAMPAGFLGRLEPLLDTVGLDFRSEGPPSNEILALAWRGLLDLDSDRPVRESLERACALGMLHLLTSSSDPALDAAFTAAKLWLKRSRLEMTMRAGNRLFMLGRRFKLADEEAAEARCFLRGAIEYFNESAQHEDLLKPPAKVKIFGMRGVAALMLARTQSDIGLILQAASDLERSHREGDWTPQNNTYRRECWLKASDISPIQADLEQLNKLLKAAAVHDRQYFCDLAQYFQILAIDIGEAAEVRAEYIRDGIHVCEQGLQLSADEDTPDAVLHNLRGFFLLLLSQVESSDGQQAVVACLDKSIADLRLAAAVGLGGGSLAQALMKRGHILKHTDVAAATEDFVEASNSLANARPELALRLRDQAETALIEARLRRDLVEDELENIITDCQLLLARTDHIHWNLGILTNALRFCWKIDHGSRTEELVAMSEAILALTMAPENPAEDAQPVLPGFVIASLAGISRFADLQRPSLRTYDLYRTAIEATETPGPKLLGQSGDAALRLAKQLAAHGDARGAENYFQDAVTWFELAISSANTADDELLDGFLPVVAHSKLGESYLRLGRNGGGGVAAAMGHAIKHFEISIELGNSSPQILGLLGDAYYRSGYHRRNQDELTQALTLKLQAQAGGHSARESLSVTSRIHFRLFELGSGIQDFAKALTTAVEASRLSPDWPWPLFQLADYARLPDDVRSASTGYLDKMIAEDEMVGLVLSGQREKILEAAVRTAVQANEFRRDILGGRSGVFVLADPHRLLSTTMVLKPMERGNAVREFDATNRLRAHLIREKLLNRFSLPVPIALVDGPGTSVVYAMERARADGLDQIICGLDYAGYHGLAETTKALEFLSVFHTWAGVEVAQRQQIDALATEFTALLSKWTGSKADRELTQKFRGLIPANTPVSRKKDAHPENWLVTDDGRIVMIDLEASANKVSLLDVAQLIDDYPVLENTDGGWSQRMDLVRGYLKAIGWTMGSDDQERGYTALCLFRCAFGLGFTSNRLKADRSSSSLKALHVRQHHYVELLNFIRKSSQFPEARDLADRLLVSWHRR